MKPIAASTAVTLLSLLLVQHVAITCLAAGVTAWWCCVRELAQQPATVQTTGEGAEHPPTPIQRATERKRQSPRKKNGARL